MMDGSDTIVAISTAVSSGARAIVRVSGAGAHSIARELTDMGTPLVAAIGGGGAGACRGRIWPGVAGWVYWFCHPRSYSGEDMVELHVPGSPVLGRMLLDEIVRRGARQAEPGEFTARAYLNGRMDLTQAEGVAATIAAHSEREMLAARQLMGGELARRLSPVMDELAQTLALVEAGIDFADDGVAMLPAAEIEERIGRLAAGLEKLLKESARFERLAHEPRIVLAGRPNAGKSTLLNALAGQQRAVVSETAGTTRDALWAEVRLARGMVRVVDVAGVVDGCQLSVGNCQMPEGGAGSFSAGDEGGEMRGIDAAMQERARAELEAAEIIVLVHALDDPRPAPALRRQAELMVRSKLDLGGAARPDLGSSSPSELWISARDGRGMAVLRERLDELAFGARGGGGTLALNARHVRSIENAMAGLRRASEVVRGGGGAELLAAEFRQALDELGGVLGRVSPDELLGRIFSQFCIGK